MPELNLNFDLPGAPPAPPLDSAEPPVYLPQFPDLPPAPPGPPPELELNVALNFDDCDAMEPQRDNFPRPGTWDVKQDNFVQTLLQRELERRRELADQERRSRAPSRTSAPSRLSFEARGPSPALDSPHDSSPDWHNEMNEAESEALAMKRGDYADHDEQVPKGVEARVQALRRRSSFIPPEKPDPVGFVREQGPADQVNNVEQMLRRVRAKKTANAQHMYDAMCSAGMVRVENENAIKLPRRPASSTGHGHHESKTRPMKKQNMEMANKWIGDTKPKGWVLFSEKAGWIQNREIQKENKHEKVKMLRHLNRHGNSFAGWLVKHGREYGIWDLEASYKGEEEDNNETAGKKSKVEPEEEKKQQPRSSMALNDGVMYKGVSGPRGSERLTHTGRFWRPNAAPTLQAPSNFHTK